MIEDKETRVFLDFGMQMGKANQYFTEFVQPRICNGMGDLFEFGLLPALEGLGAKHMGFDGKEYNEIDAIILTHAYIDHAVVDPIHIDEQIQDGDAIGSLKVIHTPGHTPGHISLYSEKHRIVFGADFLFKSVFGTEGLFVPNAVVSIDRVTAAISAKRISKVNFDKLLLAHQDSPLLENAQKEVEKTAAEAIMNLKQERWKVDV